MAVLDREAERAAQLIAVERAMTGPALPARALAGPYFGQGLVSGGEAAGFVADERVAPRPIIFAAHRAEKTLKAEPLLRQPDRPVGIAFPRPPPTPPPPHP